MYRSRKIRLQAVRPAILTFIILLSGAHYAYAQVNMPDKAVAKMTITGVVGDNSDGTIEVVGINQQLTNPPPTSVSNPGPSFSITVTKKIDKATPKLFLAGMTGDVLSQVRITWTKLNSSTNQEEFSHSILLRGVLISEVRQRPADSNNPEARQSDEYEDVTFSFNSIHGGTIEWSYTVQGGVTIVRTGWDFGRNK
ncbi:MAG: type VI secretion system tube protein Hcp [Acidobacteria bacterium]|nr:type VI secretion system tube protein Hcp [Acidobacteriota bacterium]